MRLKDILFESNVRKAEEVLKLLKSGKYRNKRRKILRAEDRKHYPAAIRDIRKDRVPLDSKRVVHEILSAMAKRPEYSEYPSRKESKFGATSDREEYLKQYGPNIYYVFPESDARICSHDEDAYYTMRDIGRLLRSNLSEFESYFDGKYDEIDYEDRKKRYDKLQKFTSAVNNYEWDRLEKVIIQSLSELIDEAEKLADEKYGGVGFSAEDIVEGFELCDEYFDNLYLGVVGSSEEIMFDGDTYLAVDRNWFDKNFQYNDGWELK